MTNIDLFSSFQQKIS